MINLLPPEQKTALQYARRNAFVVKWVIALLGAIIGVIVIVGGGQLYIARATTTIEEDTQKAEQRLEEQNISQTQSRVQEISNTLNLVVQVLSQQVLFSDLIRQVGAAIPPGAVLTNLNINEIEGGIDLAADAIDYNTATQVQVNLEDPANRIFASADILNIRCDQDSEDSYPCQISMRALFGENSQFLLITDSEDMTVSLEENDNSSEDDASEDEDEAPEEFDL